ncbi:MAG: GntR family transcriptional regulator, partial [Burkholderiaceae bacterium]
MPQVPTSAASLKIDRSAKTLRELSLEKMRDAILSGHFRPGQRLVERRLCE